MAINPNTIIWTTAEPSYPYLPLPRDHQTKRYWLTANNNKGEMQWQEQAFDEDELVELIDDAIKHELTVKVEAC
tara:strand:- start:1205 stop:1426 length:222 start_codon:yes stop_codon:yes gene_type:complete